MKLLQTPFAVRVSERLLKLYGLFGDLISLPKMVNGMKKER